MCDEPFEALSENLARDAKVALDLTEAGKANPDVADDERRPGLAGDLERAGDRTRHVVQNPRPRRGDDLSPTSMRSV